MVKSNLMLKQYCKARLNSIKRVYKNAKKKVESGIGIFKTPLESNFKTFVTISKPNSIGIQKNNKQDLMANITKQAIISAEAAVHGYHSGNWSKFSNILIDNMQAIANYESNGTSGNMSKSDEFLLAFQV